MSAEEDQKMPARKSPPRVESKEKDNQVNSITDPRRTWTSRKEDSVDDKPALAARQGPTKSNRIGGKPDEALDEIMKPPALWHGETGYKQIQEIAPAGSANENSYPLVAPAKSELPEAISGNPFNEEEAQEASMPPMQARPGAYRVAGVDGGGDDDNETTATPWAQSSNDPGSPPQTGSEVIARPVEGIPSAAAAGLCSMSRRKIIILSVIVLVIAIGLSVGLALGLQKDGKLVTSSPTFAPSVSPSARPSLAPSITPMPTAAPTDSPAPSSSPTQSPAPTLSPIPANWTQLGQDLVGGEADYDLFGQSIAMSADGNIVAVGAPWNDYNDTEDSDRGSVYVYIRNGTLWNQLGGVLRGENEYDWFGYSVALSADGTVLAVGALSNDDNAFRSGQVRIFQLVNDDWSQLGSNLNGENEFDFFGESVALSTDGNVLAVGAPDNNDNGESSGQVRIFQLVNDDWTQVGSTLNGENEYEYFGTSVALSADGTVLAVGAVQYTDEGLLPGYVHVFRLVNDDWSHVGSTLNGENEDDEFGRSVALSADGTVLAVGAPFNSNDNGEYSGQVRIFRSVNDEWLQLGRAINGKNPGDVFGTSVALSADGTVLAVGAPSNSNDNGFNSGQVRIFQLVNDDQWAQVGSAINGKGDDDEFGTSVALSADGKTVAGGADQFWNNGPGYVMVHRLEEEDE